MLDGLSLTLFNVINSFLSTIRLPPDCCSNVSPLINSSNSSNDLSVKSSISCNESCVILSKADNSSTSNLSSAVASWLLTSNVSTGFNLSSPFNSCSGFTWWSTDNLALLFTSVSLFNWLCIDSSKHSGETIDPFNISSNDPTEVSDDASVSSSSHDSSSAVS